MTQADELDARPADTAKELLALSDSELLNYCRDDAGKWAAAFSAIKSAQGWGSNDIDEALMTTWFANAIEQATSCRLSARQQASVESLVELIAKRWYWDMHSIMHDHDENWRKFEKRELYLSVARYVLRALLAKYYIFEKVEG